LAGADQLRLICDGETATAERPVGGDGTVGAGATFISIATLSHKSFLLAVQLQLTRPSDSWIVELDAPVTGNGIGLPVPLMFHRSTQVLLSSMTSPWIDVESITQLFGYWVVMDVVGVFVEPLFAAVVGIGFG